MRAVGSVAFSELMSTVYETCEIFIFQKSILYKIHIYVKHLNQRVCCDSILSGRQSPPHLSVNVGDPQPAEATQGERSK